VLGNPNLSEADREHIGRWLDEADDPVWEQIAADAESYGELPPFVDGPYSYFIGSALRLRNYVQTELDKPSLLRKRERERREQKFTDWMAFATMMDEVVRRYQAFQQAHIPPDDPSGRRRQSELPLQWLEQEAQRIRHRAQDLLKEPDDWGLGYGPVRVKVSRQKTWKRGSNPEQSAIRRMPMRGCQRA
jgi:hypothetical protein